MDSLDMVRKNIEKLRMDMIDLAERYGRGHPSAITSSMQLDELLNQYERMKQEKKIKERVS